VSIDSKPNLENRRSRQISKLLHGISLPGYAQMSA
jgi:hypothetical protein